LESNIVESGRSLSTDSDVQRDLLVLEGTADSLVENDDGIVDCLCGYFGDDLGMVFTLTWMAF
jgi:hypothetical protein